MFYIPDSHLPVVAMIFDDAISSFSFDIDTSMAFPMLLWFLFAVALYFAITNTMEYFIKDKDKDDYGSF